MGKIVGLLGFLVVVAHAPSAAAQQAPTGSGDVLQTPPLPGSSSEPGPVEPQMVARSYRGVLAASYLGAGLAFVGLIFLSPYAAPLAWFIAPGVHMYYGNSWQAGVSFAGQAAFQIGGGIVGQKINNCDTGDDSFCDLGAFVGGWVTGAVVWAALDVAFLATYDEPMSEATGVALSIVPTPRGGGNAVLTWRY